MVFARRYIEMLVIGKLFIVLSTIVAIAWSTSEPDFSAETEPYMKLDVFKIQPAKEERNFDGQIVPAENATIELVCSVEYESVPASLDALEFKLKWIVPNEYILEEKRAFVKTDNIERITLLITDFQSQDDGQYICRLEVDGEDSGYEKSITIPAMDGTPIIKCDLSCERNTDEDCQVMEYMSMYCDAWGFPEPRINCRFDECEDRDSCPLALFYPQDYIHYGGSSYAHENKRVVDDLALVSGMYTCEAGNHKGKAEAEVFVPISAGTLKANARQSSVRRHFIKEGEERKVFLRRQPTYYSVGEEVKLSCYTNTDTDEIQWFHYGSSPFSTTSKVSNDSFEGVSIMETSSSSGHASQLVFSQYNFDQGGMYQCKIKTDNGTEWTHDFFLETHKWASDANMDENRHFYIMKGSNFTFRCTIDSVKNGPDVYWKKDGDEDKIHRNFHKYDLNHNSQVLTIESAELRDTGVFECRARKRIGIEEYNLNGRVYLTVLERKAPPHPIGGTTDPSPGEGSSQKGEIIDNIATAIGTIQEHLKTLSETLKNDKCPRRCD